jgi:uncharacterized protein
MGKQNRKEAPMPVTSLLAAVLGLMLVALSFSVSIKRMAVNTHIGVGNDEGLLRRIRAQGNFIEYVPIALILCGLAEYRNAGLAWMWAIAGLLLFGRIAHASGMLTASTPLRVAGMLGTYGAILTGAAAQILG